MSAGNANIATALSTIVQVAGLTIIGGGALTDSGQQKLRNLLEKSHIPQRFYAAMTFVFALIVLLFAFISNASINAEFIKDGQRQYAEGDLNNARIAYLQAKEINPKEIAVHDNLAKIYESEGKLSQAVEQYMIGSAKGEISSLTGLGRSLINKGRYPDLKLAEAYLLMALQRAYQNSTVSAYTQYQLNRNMGWVLIHQKQYEKAIEYLKKALQWRSQVNGYASEGGTGNCFLAYAYEKNSKAQLAEDNWKKCIQYAKPDYIHEYRWLLEIGKHDIAACVDTSKIVGGSEASISSKVKQQCQHLFD